MEIISLMVNSISIIRVPIQARQSGLPTWPGIRHRDNYGLESRAHHNATHRLAVSEADIHGKAEARGARASPPAPPPIHACSQY